MNPELIRAFVFMRKDPKFTVKLAILGAAMFVPIVGWILALGYCVMLYRNYIDGKDDEMILPEWEDFGNYVFKLNFCRKTCLVDFPVSIIYL